MARKKKQTKEERLEKKRIAEKIRYEKIKNDPQRLAAEKEKRKQKYKKLREKRQARKKNTPSNLNDELVGPEFRDHEQPQQVNFEINVPETLAPKPNPRLKSTREQSQKQRYKRNQEIKQKMS
ncbi:unnamed protein product [Euphydryas editha]|uniref:Uncharacterized protein n=1 Tax=Euphydryas editha TaxID=104508 RepID=A0AAU9THY5_EUPED|nr:unnamed protein product [Euphydryas editha]